MSFLGWLLFAWLVAIPVGLLTIALVAARRTNREFARVVDFDDWRRSYDSTRAVR